MPEKTRDYNTWESITVSSFFSNVRILWMPSREETKRRELFLELLCECYNEDIILRGGCVTQKERRRAVTQIEVLVRKNNLIRVCVWVFK
jgi:hypothetical protein